VLRRPRASARGRRLFVVASPGSRRAAVAGSLLAASALALGAHAATGSDRSAPLAGSIAASFSQTEVSGDALEPAPGSAAPGASGARLAGGGDDPGRARLKLAHYIGVDFQTIPPGGAQLFEIRCPNAAERPLAGGSFAPSHGLVAVNSSRMSPSTEVPTAPRAWYQAVVNIMSVPLQWKPIVTCARRK
jgi:hypothetical protein